MFKFTNNINCVTLLCYTTYVILDKLFYACCDSANITNNCLQLKGKKKLSTTELECFNDSLHLICLALTVDKS